MVSGGPKARSPRENSVATYIVASIDKSPMSRRGRTALLGVVAVVTIAVSVEGAHAGCRASREPPRKEYRHHEVVAQGHKTGRAEALGLHGRRCFPARRWHAKRWNNFG